MQTIKDLARSAALVMMMLFLIRAVTTDDKEVEAGSMRWAIFLAVIGYGL